MIEPYLYNDKDHNLIARLAHGEAPMSEEILNELSVGIDFITDFWSDKYLKEFIPFGGSKIKFITGLSGSGKSHTLYTLSSIATKLNYITASFSAHDIWLHDFKDVYLEILRQGDLPKLLEICSHKIIEAMGFDYKEIPQGMTFIDFLGQQGLADGITRREIRLQLKNMFLDNPLLDNNFALACSLLCGGILGHPFLEPLSRQLLLSWLSGDKTIKVSTLRPLGLAPTRITKFNARHMLRSLAEVVRLSGHTGLFVSIDNLEVLVEKSSLEAIRYTKMRRDDTYESIRQLIDDIDSFHNIMFVFTFDRVLLDDENKGLKSYQALWMRIQNEVVGNKINRFSDIIDMDAVALQLFTPQMVLEMSRKLAEVVNNIDMKATTINEEKALEIIRVARMGGVSIPRLVNQATLQMFEGVLL